MTLQMTRDGWHRVAEHILAAAQYADSGEIALSVADGGFQTSHALSGRKHLRVDGSQLVVVDESGTRATPLTTLRAAADFAEVTPALPETVYPPATPLELDAPLSVDAASARVLADWYELADSALRRLAAGVGSDEAPILWPEHFDVGITVDAVNYGASPGDDRIPRPYLYVGPHAGPPVRDDFWNTAFGAVRTRDAVSGIEAAVAFFVEGRDRLASRRRTG